MARIIENFSGNRRIIKLTTDDIISVVREYQRIVNKPSNFKETRSLLEDNVIFLPEDV